MINLTLVSLINNDILIINRNEELCGLLILNSQFSESGFGIRATYEINNYQINIEESFYQINIDITYIQPIAEEDNEYISDEDFTEFEQTYNQEWNNNLEHDIPISWFNNFERLNLDEINSTDHIYDTTDWGDQSPSPRSV